jgi:polar amino acid transport system substrate-binding protein
VRAAEIEFTAPYVIIEGVYMVPRDSALKTVADVDRSGVRVAVNKGSAYDLFLTRTLKHAELVRGENGIELFMQNGLEAAAGVKQPIVAFAKANPSMRVMDGRFMEIQQAMGTPKGRSAGARYLRAFVEEMKATGFVADALKRSNQPDASVAPPAAP